MSTNPEGDLMTDIYSGQYQEEGKNKIRQFNIQLC